MNYLKLLSIFLLIGLLTGCKGMKEINGVFIHLDKDTRVENLDFRVVVPEIADGNEQEKNYKEGNFKIKYPRKQNIEGTPIIILDKNSELIAKENIPVNVNRVIVLFDGVNSEMIFVEEEEDFDKKYTLALEEFKKLSKPSRNHTPIYPGCENKDTKDYPSCFKAKINRHIARYLDVHSLDMPVGRKRINVLFEVDESGEVNVISVSTTHAELKKEILRVFKKLPKMHPAMENNQPIKTEYNFPIVVSVQ